MHFETVRVIEREMPTRRCRRAIIDRPPSAVSTRGRRGLGRAVHDQRPALSRRSDRQAIGGSQEIHSVEEIGVAEVKRERQSQAIVQNSAGLPWPADICPISVIEDSDIASEKQDRIAQRAYAIWQAEGHPDGRHEEHWHRAAGEIETADRINRSVKPTTRRKTRHSTGSS